MLFATAEMRSFCSQWEQAASALGYEDGDHFGPTADDYFAWRSTRHVEGYVQKERSQYEYRVILYILLLLYMI